MDKQTEQKKEEPINQPPISERPKERGINERLKDIEEKIDLTIPKQKGKQKFFSMPFGFALKQKNIEKSFDKVQWLLLSNNGNVLPLVKQVKNGYIEHNGKYYDTGAAFVYRWRGKTPTYVQPEWRISPLGPQDYESAVKAQLSSLEAQKTLIRAMEQAKLEEKTQFKGSTIVWLGIGAMVVGYILFAGA